MTHQQPTPSHSAPSHRHSASVLSVCYERVRTNGNPFRSVVLRCEQNPEADFTLPLFFPELCIYTYRYARTSYNIMLIMFIRWVE